MKTLRRICLSAGIIFSLSPFWCFAFSPTCSLVSTPSSSRFAQQRSDCHSSRSRSFPSTSLKDPSKKYFRSRASGLSSLSKTVLFNLFDDEPEIKDIVEHYVRNKIQFMTSYHQGMLNGEDAEQILREILPPVTPEALYKETQLILASIRNLDQENLVQAIVRNRYWEAAGEVTVKELVYFDTLFHYYYQNVELLDSDDYDELKTNLAWEGSSVATMTSHEALFVTAIAASRRCEPIMKDEDYDALKRLLKEQNSWVTAHQKDALEKHGHLNTFLGYIHTSLELKTEFDCLPSF